MSSPVATLVMPRADEPSALEVSAAFHALTHMGRPAVPELTRLLNVAKYRTQALQALARIGGDARLAIGDIRPLLHSVDRRTQALAVVIIGQMGRDAVNTIPELLRLASHESPELQANVLIALGAIQAADRRSIPEELNVRIRRAVHNAADHPHPIVRRATVQAINTLPQSSPSVWRESLERLAVLLFDSDIDVQRAAADVLMQAGDSSFFQLREFADGYELRVGMHIAARLDVDLKPLESRIASMLKSASVEDRLCAMKALRGVDSASRLSLELAFQGLADDNEAVRRAAEDAMSGRSELPKTELLEALRSKDAGAAQHAATLLASICAVDELTTVLCECGGESARLAAIALGKIGPEAQPAVDKLLELIFDVDLRTQREIVRTLGFIQSKSAIDSLILLFRQSELLAPECLDSLGKIGCSDRAILEMLVNALESSNPLIVASSASAISRLDIAEKERPCVLKSLARSRNLDVRLAAAKCLARFGSQGIEDLSQIAIQDEADDTRLTAITALASADSESLAVGHIMKELVNDRMAEIRSTAAAWLGKHGCQSSLSILLPLLTDEASAVRRVAVEGLSNTGDRFVPALILMLDDENNDIVEVIKVLSLLGKDASAAAPQLAAVLGRPGTEVNTRRARSAAVRALGRIGAASVPPVEDLLDSGSAEERLQALAALAEIGLPAGAVAPTVASRLVR